MGLKSEMENLNAIKRPKLVELEGIPMLSEMAENWYLISGFQARPDDLLLCTYPKAGTTWIQEIVDMVQHRGDAQKCARAPIYERNPYIELFPPKPIPSGFELALAMPSPRTLKSHLPVQLLPTSFWEQNCKIIYVARNAKDCAVSFFHFHRMNKILPDPGKWGDFLENFITGKVCYGSWFDHVRGWWEAKGHHSILYLFYEDIKENPTHEIQKVAEFLNIELSESVLDQIVQHTRFESMKDNPMANYSNMPSFVFDQIVSPFMRKGTVGDWKENFTVAQSQQLDEICIQQLGNSGLKFRTELDFTMPSSCPFTKNLREADIMRILSSHEFNLWIVQEKEKSEMEALEDKSIKYLKQVEFKGILMLSEMAENWNLISGFQARPDDLLLCTYPKAGTTWIQEIVDMIQHRGDAQKCARAPINERIPYIELLLPKPIPSGFELALAMPSPRTLKSHLPVQLLPTSFWEQNCKIIYVARNVKDCAVSYFYFHHMVKMVQDPGKWEDFLENFIAGKVNYGSWFDHVRGWWEAKDHHPILYLFYEDIKENPTREIQKVAEFLNIELSESVLDKIVRHTTFENMKDNPMTNYSNIPSFLMDQTVSTFMRKGIVGNWKEHFTVAQSEWLDELCIQQLGNSGLKFRTEL